MRKRAHQNLAVAAEALAGGVLQQESLSHGVSGTLGSGNGRIKRAASILLQAAATGARRKQHSPLSVVAIGGSITSGRMLDSYCKDCVDEVKYRDVWSTRVERTVRPLERPPPERPPPSTTQRTPKRRSVGRRHAGPTMSASLSSCPRCRRRCVGISQASMPEAAPFNRKGRKGKAARTGGNAGSEVDLAAPSSFASARNPSVRGSHDGRGGGGWRGCAGVVKSVL